VKPFAYTAATSLDQAQEILSEEWGSRLYAGGTDLLTLTKRGTVSPDHLVDIKGLADFRYLRHLTGGGLAIGALTTLAELEANRTVHRRFPALARSIAVTGTPQLRNRATVGGNLCQQPRCWYYRGDFPCLLHGDEVCGAAKGENAYHALFGYESADGNRCVAVHPSDPAVALSALEAEVVVAVPGEAPVNWEATPIDDLFQQPTKDFPGTTILNPGDVVVEIRVPEQPKGSRQVYLKAMDRAAWAFALVSVAAVATLDGNRLADLRLALGGVAYKPWRARHAEEIARGHVVSPELVDEIVELAAEGAMPLGANEYKVPLLKGLVRQALRAVTDESRGI